MPTVVELISASDVVALYDTPSTNGYVYNNATLDAWYSFAGAEADIKKRPNAHGAYSPGRVFATEHRPVLAGKFFGDTSLTALAARNRLLALFADGNAVTMRVTDDTGPTTRQVWLLDAKTLWQHEFSYFPFDLAFVAPDPRRYGTQITTSDGMPSAGGGLTWNLGTAGSGRYWEWGAAGTTGQVVFTNTGAAETLPRIDVGGPGAIETGVRITEVETGRELIFSRTIGTTETVSFDSRTQRATIGGSDVTNFLSKRQWFSVPAGATRRYQINPLGGVSGAPTFTLYASPAYL